MRGAGSHASSPFEDENRGTKTEVASTRRLNSLLDTPEGLPDSTSKDSPWREILGPHPSALLERGTSSSRLDKQPEAVAQRPLVLSIKSQQSSASPGVNADKSIFLKYSARRCSKGYARLEKSEKSAPQASVEEQGTKDSNEHEPASNIVRSDLVGSSGNESFAASSPGAVARQKSSGMTAAPRLGSSTNLENDSRQGEELPPGKSLTFAKPSSSQAFVIPGNCEATSGVPLKTATTWHGSSLEDSAATAPTLKSMAAHPQPVSGHEPKENKKDLPPENHVSAGADGTGVVRSSEPGTSRPGELVQRQKTALFGDYKLPQRDEPPEIHTAASEERTTYRSSEPPVPNPQLIVSREPKESNVGLAPNGETSSDSGERPAKRKSSQHTTEVSPVLEASRTAAQTPHQEQAPVIASDVPVHINAPMTLTKEHLLYPLSMCLAFILFTVVTLLFLPEYVPYFRHKTKARAPKGRSSVTCSSMACLQNALYLNTLVSWNREKPCNDFYSFVCLRWMNSFCSPFENSVSANDDVVAFLEQRIHETLQDNARNSKTLRPLKDLYDKCNNYAVIEESGWATLRNLLSELSLAEFPLTHRTPTNLSVWQIAAELVRETGTVALLSIGVAFHPVFAAIDVASVGPPQVIARKSVGLEEAIDLYATAIFWVTHLSEGRSFSTSVAAATQKFAGNIERLAHVGTKESTAKVQNIDTRSTLLKFVTDVLSELQVSFFSVATPAVLIRSPDIVGDVVNLVERTETYIVVNYLVLRLFIQVAPFLPYSGVHDVNGALVYGKLTTRAPRSRLCLRAVERALFPAVHIHLFTETKLKTSEPTLVNFVHLVIEEFNAVVNDSPLFDNRSKGAIRRALANSDFEAFGPGWTKNAALALTYLDTLPAVNTNESSLDTYIKYHRHTLAYSLERGAKMRWSGSAFSDDCWYETNPWTVYVPLLAFNGTQVLNKSDVDALQLSRMAPRLVRCLFDMLLEAADSKKGQRWLTENTWRNLVTAESSFKQQLVDLRFGHLRDVLATRTAFRVFEKVIASSDVVHFTVKRKGVRVFTSEQMFFASLMLQNCEAGGRPRKLRPSADSEKWSVALQNTREFAETFNCTLANNIN
ncbi:hypothetical protein MTO96_047522 [Rhipicephalus appendiculatus]